MSGRYTSIIGSPVQDVFAWHERPGAIERLSPPWLPLRVAQEARSLRDGRAILKLPGGISWVAQHRGAVPPEGFVDELARFPRAWRHTHTFTPQGEASTVVTDTIETPIPGRLLEQVLVYRHRQLAADLAMHDLARRLRPEPLTVAITGSSGLVGGALVPLLTTGGHRVIRLVRRSPRGADERQWEPDHPKPDLLEGVDAVVHLAGASIAGRFTAAHKREARDSRIGPTAQLAALIARSAERPSAFVVASAIGYYGPDRGDEVLNEASERGTGFLADLVDAWESAADPARRAGVRVVSVRTGIVQSPRGGVLRLLRPLFEVGLGGRLGTGRQWMSWIDIEDLADIYYRALVDDALAGPVNGVAPHAVTNSEYASTLARVLHRPAVVPVPPFGPRVLLGAEGVREFALASQRVEPRWLTKSGHRFRCPTLESSLRHELGRQLVPASAPAGAH